MNWLLFIHVQVISRCFGAAKTSLSSIPIPAYVPAGEHTNEDPVRH